ncbi:MAG: sigma-54-dependent Fis family transcriptional regulator [Deltaproteobacteria bacterium]|nr:MAG: sigma-54-dependent Fis family transcriptional regulator [Deltaproteobacteria bacterium]
MPTVLVVDDDATTRHLVRRRLEAAGFDCESARTAAEAIQKVEAGFHGVVLLDLQLPDMDGRTVLPTLRHIDPTNPVVILTSHGTADIALDSLREGAFDFLDKELIAERLVSTVKRAADSLPSLRLGGRLPDTCPYPGIVARSPEMHAVCLAIENAVASSVPIMLRGESGTGKEVVARAIHQMGPRANKPFVAVNCAAIPETLLEAELFGYERGAFTGAVARKRGRFELAAGGTLMLDEIGELHPLLQAKLLRVVQDGEYQRLGGTETLRADVRLISATNRDLETEVAAGRFREDLYYRMAVFAVHLPPLRKRTGDIPLLIQHFIDEFREREGKDVRSVDPLARELLESYSYPGNVRELQNIIAHAVVSARGPTIAISDLPQAFLRAVRDERGRTDPVATRTPDPHAAPAGAAGPGGAASPRSGAEETAPGVEGGDAGFPTLAEVEASHVRRAMEHARGNKALAARLLGVSRMTLYRKLQEAEKLSRSDTPVSQDDAGSR